jgi:phosphoenolpyruvate carboxylase
MSEISSGLKALVNQVVSILGHVIEDNLGSGSFQRIETLRKKMAGLRTAKAHQQEKILTEVLSELRELKPQQQHETAIAFTLMLELMNTCENAYRSYRLRQKHNSSKELPDSIIYVLTAHPTEARSPNNIRIFHRIQSVLISVFERESQVLKQSEREELFFWVQFAWKISPTRSRKPQVRDEAEHIFSTVCRNDVMQALLKCSANLAPVYLRSWVGGDKDGHPGVNEKTFVQSLKISRSHILSLVRMRLMEIERSLPLLSDSIKLHSLFADIKLSLVALRDVEHGDSRRIQKLRTRMREFYLEYVDLIDSPHPALTEIHQLFKMFPALVIPLEFRESSDLVAKAVTDTKQAMAISRMLKKLAHLSAGGEPRWYVRGLIVSMTNSFEDLKNASFLVKRSLHGLKLPIVPLLEQASALRSGPQIAKQMLTDKEFSKARKKYWDNYLEIMLGYSDSSKESGVWFSRLLVAETMHALDALCQKHKATPLFFQGSGGSVDRGGGTIEEQTSWWSSSALRNYKVTIQGEMVERSFSNSDITRGQIESIAMQAGKWKERKGQNFRIDPLLNRFAELASKHYKEQVHDVDFLKMAQRATPYSFLNFLKLGSRPSKRSKMSSVDSLRAIPWVLCWTQTRVLFPTWWGIGSAWKSLSATDQKKLARLYGKEAIFSTYIQALAFTVEKIEMSVWKMYLKTFLEPSEANRFFDSFEKEFRGTTQFLKSITNSKSILQRRPWLIESIWLRSPMIHPLNMLQIIAMENKDAKLLQVTTAGISAGMMSTG